MLESGYALSVTELNEYVNGLLRRDPLLGEVRVQGELSGFKRHSSGHLYFMLKDEGALVRCVMFRQAAQMLAFSPRDGLSVRVEGSVSLYVKDGQYQLYVQNMRLEGEGELFRRFLLLKTRLESLGYFDPARKKKLPFLPKCVGVITSPTGAAVQDIIHITRRRFPSMNILLYPVRVQGEGAAKEIAQAIKEMDEAQVADVIIVGRGGGSLEDLWAFNEMAVAEAVFACETPIVSAVGHETDFSICDFVADLRASTPSAAAELCVPEYDALFSSVRERRAFIQRSIRGELSRQRERLLALRDSAGFVQPGQASAKLRRDLETKRGKLRDYARNLLVYSYGALEVRRSGLSALSPSGVLRRGYTLVRATDGRVLTSAGALCEGEVVKVFFHDGNADAKITQITMTEGEEPAYEL